MKSCRTHPAWAPWLFLLPFLLGFGSFIAWPLLRSLVLALEQTFGPKTTVFVGLLNFKFLLKDPMFWTAMRNTVQFTFWSLVVQVPVALGLALLLNRPDLRGKRFFRLVFFSPSIVGLAFVAVLFGMMFEKRNGLINMLLHQLIRAWNPDFLWLENYVMLSLVVAQLWISAGLYMIYFLAALQNVSPELLEASSIDGAGPWQRFWHVTLPAIRPVLNLIVLLIIIMSFQLFELPYILFDTTAGNGPENRALTVATYLYQTGFRTGDLGYASAVGWVMTLVMVCIAFVHRRLTRSEEL